MRKISLIAIMVLVLAGCSTAGPGDFCLVSEPIRPSESDGLTTGTARQVLAHNEYGAKVCGWRP